MNDITKDPITYDRSLLALLTILMILQAVMVFSTSAHESIIASDGGVFTIFYKNLSFIAISIIAFAIVSSIKMSFYQHKNTSVMVMVIFLVIMILPFFFSASHGAHRWIKFAGLSIQPVEFAKILVMIFYAKLCADHQELIRVSKFKSLLITFAMPLIIICLILFAQKDFGSILLLLLSLVILSLLVGLRIIIFMSCIPLGILVAVLGIITSDYRLNKILAWWDPEKYQQTYGFQILEARNAIGNGGFFGQGLGNSVQKMGYLPEANTDYVMAIVAEELGFVGVALIIILFAYFTYRGFSIAQKNLEYRRVFTGYLAFGLTLLMVLQTLFHLAVVTNFIPSKGLTFPFISYGGSSLVASTIIIALVMRIDYEIRILEQNK